MGEGRGLFLDIEMSREKSASDTKMIFPQMKHTEPALDGSFSGHPGILETERIPTEASTSFLLNVSINRECWDEVMKD